MATGKTSAIQHACVTACAVAAGFAVWSVSRWRASRRAAIVDGADGAQAAGVTPSPAGASARPTQVLDPSSPAQGSTPVDLPPPAQSAVIGADTAKAAKLLELAANKKQSGNEALAAGRLLEALEFFDGALAALRYVVPGANMSDSPDVAEARVLQVLRVTMQAAHRMHSQKRQPR